MFIKRKNYFLTGPINSYISSLVSAQLLFLESENNSKEIYLYINSPGGETDGLAIYDTMQFIKPTYQHSVLVRQLQWVLFC